MARKQATIFYISPELLADLQILAKEQDVSMSQILRYLAAAIVTQRKIGLLQLPGLEAYK